MKKAGREAEYSIYVWANWVEAWDSWRNMPVRNSQLCELTKELYYSIDVAAGKLHLPPRPYREICMWGAFYQRKRVGWVSHLAEGTESRIRWGLRETKELNDSARAENQTKLWGPQKSWKGVWASLQVCNGDLGQIFCKSQNTEWPQLKYALC